MQYGTYMYTVWHMRHISKLYFISWWLVIRMLFLGDWWLGCLFPGDWWLAILFLGDWWLENLFLGDGYFGVVFPGRINLMRIGFPKIKKMHIDWYVITINSIKVMYDYQKRPLPSFPCVPKSPIRIYEVWIIVSMKPPFKTTSYLRVYHQVYVLYPVITLFMRDFAI